MYAIAGHQTFCIADVKHAELNRAAASVAANGSAALFLN
jgi:hypothetical protein